MHRFALSSRAIVTPDGVKAGAVIIDGEHIAAIVHDDHDDYTALADRMPVTDLGDLAILPGLVDSHVHVNEPGRADWEGWATANAAALAGGITALVDMPLNSSPVTITVEALAEKRAAAAASSGESGVDRYFWAGLVPGMRADTIAALGAEPDVRGFKCFMTDSGIEEFKAVSLRDLAELMPHVAATGLPLLAHAELVPTDGSAPSFTGDERSHAAWAATRPPGFELDAVHELLALAAESDCQVHVVHVSSAETAAHLHLHASMVTSSEEFLLTRARASWETCPHYLLLDAEVVPDGATEFKCAPPLRSAAENAALWFQVLSDQPAIVSDHSPAPPTTKSRETGSFQTAWGGIASLGLQLPLINTALVQRGAPLTRDERLLFLATTMSLRPAELAGLTPQHGAIAPGSLASLAIVDLDAEWVIHGADAGWRWPLTPYEGRRVCGRVVATYVRGEKRFAARA